MLLETAFIPARASAAVCQNVSVLGSLGSVRSRFVHPRSVAPASRVGRSLRSLMGELPWKSQLKIEAEGDRAGVGVDGAVVDAARQRIGEPQRLPVPIRKAGERVQVLHADKDPRRRAGGAEPPPDGVRQAVAQGDVL